MDLTCGKCLQFSLLTLTNMEIYTMILNNSSQDWGKKQQYGGFWMFFCCCYMRNLRLILYIIHPYGTPPYCWVYLPIFPGQHRDLRRSHGGRDQMAQSSAAASGGAWGTGIWGDGWIKKGDLLGFDWDLLGCHGDLRCKVTKVMWDWFKLITPRIFWGMGDIMYIYNLGLRGRFVIQL